MFGKCKQPWIACPVNLYMSSIIITELQPSNNKSVRAAVFTCRPKPTQGTAANHAAGSSGATAGAQATSSSGSSSAAGGGCPVKPDVSKCQQAAKSFAGASASASASSTASGGGSATANAVASASASSSSNAEDFTSACFQEPYKLAIKQCGSVSSPQFVPLYLKFCSGTDGSSAANAAANAAATAASGR